MILVCPECRGFDDRPDDLCGMCSDPGVGAEWCDHTHYERFNDGCTCRDECDRCGAEREPNGDCWRCDEAQRIERNLDAMFPLSSPALVDSATKGPESR